MKFLLDENISPKTVNFLKELGHDAIHVRNVNLKGAQDDEIIKYAKQYELVLITIDRDFGNILDYPPGSHPGIIRLKLQYMPSRIVNFTKKGENVIPKFVRGNYTKELDARLQTSGMTNQKGLDSPVSSTGQAQSSTE